ncbi:hypothetical protein J7T55_009852 [Diaporthe amygdali]|uniref:uncharacterized protein n=1 Tax=Phomopsis amygdali TaxID=1214568 RepID=UPI0022FEC1CC|nr:uncharacterized protein J7T55_009852 [Diaporthe amygdali]KAJ0116702.1 hypothetical protein J7T55_009852 [Diaporthe amygdali]
MESSSPNTSGRISDGDQQKPKAISAVAQQAYDRYGFLDPIKLDLMTRGIFITREEAATLPNRITTEICPEARIADIPRHRPSKSRAAHRTPVTPVTRATPLTQASSATRASSVASSARADISAVPSDHEKWTESDTKLIIKLRAERVGFRQIADRFPSKNQKAVQEKFYKSTKDHREPHWKRLYNDLRTRHDKKAYEDNTVVEAVKSLVEDNIMQSPENENTIIVHDVVETKGNTIENEENMC